MSLVNADISQQTRLSLTLPRAVTTADGTHQSHYESRGRTITLKQLESQKPQIPPQGKPISKCKEMLPVQQQNQPISAGKTTQWCQSKPVPDRHRAAAYPGLAEGFSVLPCGLLQHPVLGWAGGGNWEHPAAASNPKHRSPAHWDKNQDLLGKTSQRRKLN